MNHSGDAPDKTSFPENPPCIPPKVLRSVPFYTSCPAPTRPSHCWNYCLQLCRLFSGYNRKDLNGNSSLEQQQQQQKDFTLPWPFTASNCLICFLSSVEISDQEMQPGVLNSPTEQTGTSGLVMGAGEHLCQKEWVLSARENQATDSPELLISG